MHVVKIACERPDDAGRSLSQWDCAEIARRLVRDGVVKSIAAETVRQILLHHRLKPLVSTQQEPLYWQLLGTDLLCRPSEVTRGCLIRRPWETRDWGRGRPRIDRYDRHRGRAAPLRRDPSPQGVAAKSAVEIPMVPSRGAGTRASRHIPRVAGPPPRPPRGVLPPPLVLDEPTARSG